MEADSLENEVGAACDNYIVIWQKGTLLLLQKVTAAEQNYNRGSRQLFTNKAALKEWHLWLNVQLSFFFILTNRQNLEYVKSAKWLNSYQARFFLADSILPRPTKQFIEY